MVTSAVHQSPTRYRSAKRVRAVRSTGRLDRDVRRQAIRFAEVQGSELSACISDAPGEWRWAPGTEIREAGAIVAHRSSEVVTPGTSGFGCVDSTVRIADRQGAYGRGAASTAWW